MKDWPDDPREILPFCDCICEREVVEDALDRMAAQIEAQVGTSTPLVLAVLLGGLYPAMQLIQRFAFPYELDYVHATRYRGKTNGGELSWLALPRTPLAGRTVLVVDDILDEGITLEHIVDFCTAGGAAATLSAVLTRKPGPKTRLAPDFVGLDMPDRYVFGCGMDYRGYFRGMPRILALPDGVENTAGN